MSESPTRATATDEQRARVYGHIEDLEHRGRTREADAFATVREIPAEQIAGWLGLPPEEE